MTLGAGIATLVPLATLAVVARLGRTRGLDLALLVAAGAAGASATWWLAEPENTWLDAHGGYSLAVVGAPILEELGKAAILPLLLLARRLRWYVDGVIVGLAAGTGFAIRENYVFLARAPDAAVEYAVARVTSTNLMHAACTAIVGAALATPALRRRGRVALTLPVALVLAMALHSAFNRLTFQSSAALTTTLVGVSVFLTAGGLVWLGEPLSRRWARADMMRLGLARGEAEVLGRRRSVDDLLAEMLQRFGKDAAEAARDLIGIQKQIGVATQPGAVADSRHIDALRQTANEARRRVGTFAMLWLRSRLPSEDELTGLWSAAVQATTESVARTAGTAPGGLWGSLDDRQGAATPLAADDRDTCS